MKVIKEIYPRLFLLELFTHRDNRGSFHKIFNKNYYSIMGLPFMPAENFITISRKDVIRGMHFQYGRSAHEKIVFCVSGKILDVVVDVRKESPYYNKPYSITLGENEPYGLFIGKGYAHGFLSITEGSCITYLVSKQHNPSFDSGVLWSSINFDWPVASPIISLRDTALPMIGKCKCIFS